MLIFVLATGYFSKYNVSALIIYLSFTISAVLVLFWHKRISQSPQFAKITVGIFLVLLAAISSFNTTSLISGIVECYFLFSDSAMYIILISFVIALFVSMWYFSFYKLSRKFILTLHLLGIGLFIALFSYQLTNIRTNQALVLKTYQDFRQAVRLGNYEFAYQLMSPSYQQTHTVDDLANDDYFLSQASEGINSIYAVEYVFWKRSAYIVTSYDYPNPPTFWKRPTQGISLYFEYVDGQWLFTGQTAFHLIE